jgi:hypothetical protein
VPRAFAHESVVVDPRRHTLYLTEDAGKPNGLLYRWTPPLAALPLGKGSLRALADDAGTLEAMQAFTRAGAFVPDLAVATEPGTTYRVRWLPVPERDATKTPVRKQFGQITRSHKLEGMWWDDEGAYFVASFARTSDGSAAQHDGQVWFIEPEDGTIELKLHFAYTPDDHDNDPDGPDNITVSAYGGLILAEDGDGKNHLVGATPRGEVFFFARNELAGNNEFAGPTFSRDKKILFANIQSPGARLRNSGTVSQGALPRSDRTRAARGSGVLDGDPREDVRGLLAAVDRVLEALEEIFPADDHRRIDTAHEQRRDRSAHDAVTLVLQAMDLDQQRAQAAHVLESVQGLGELRAGLAQHAGKLLGGFHRRLDLIQAEIVGDLLGEVDDVVQRAREAEDVLAVERSC